MGAVNKRHLGALQAAHKSGYGIPTRTHILTQLVSFLVSHICVDACHSFEVLHGLLDYVMTKLGKCACAVQSSFPHVCVSVHRG